MALLAAYIEEVRIWIGRLAEENSDGIYRVGQVAFAATDGVADAVNVSTTFPKSSSIALSVKLTSVQFES